MIKKITALIVLLVLGAVIFYFYNTKPKEKVDLLIQNGHVLTMNSSMEEYGSGWVAVKDGKILDLGPGKPVKYSAKKTIDAEGQVVMPGLINTHSHAGMAKLVGIGQGQPLEGWLKTMEAQEAKFTAEDVYQGAKQAIEKMLSTGTTTFNDMYFYPEKTVQAVSEAGIRAIIRIPINREGEKLLFDESILKNSQGNPNITFSVAPNPFLEFSLDELKQVSDYALSKNLLVHVHFDEDSATRQEALSKYGLSPYAILEKSGLLRNKLLLAHAGDINDVELKDLAQHPNAAISYNPISEYNLQTPLSPVQKISDLSIPVALGTDGAPSSDLDMFAQMRFTGKDFLDFNKIIKMATIDGARALGLEKEIGSLELGKKADIIIVKVLTKDAVTHALVYNTKGDSVTHTIINGQVLK